MEFKISFHSQAEFELLESNNWYRARSSKAHQKFITEFENTIKLIQKNPLQHPIVYDTKRKAILKTFPFSIVYIIHHQTITIISIFHQSRNPEIWKKR